MQTSHKNTIAAVLAAVLLCGVIVVGVTGMLFNRDRGNTKSETIREITELESLTLRFSGMRVTEEYEIICNGAKAEIAYYHIRYGDEDEHRALQNSAVCDTQEVLEILNACNAGKWNGFHGKHPKGVKDGRMFVLSASVNGGQKLHADGSQNFPPKFSAFEEWLRNLLN